MATQKTDTYLGNRNLKRSYVEIEWTKQQIQEYIKCAKDPVYFIENYVKIVHVDKGLIPFTPYEFQKEIIRKADQDRFVICKMPRQVGKALCIDTPILTPNGFNLLKNLKVGDVVYGPDGIQTRITFITDVMHDHDVYEVIFDNGDFVKADGDHLWTVNSTNWTAGKRTLTTKDLINFVGHSNKPFIDFTEPLQFQHKELLIDPYLLGVWLGDGATKGASITCHKDDLSTYKNFLDINHTWTDSRNSNVMYFTAPCGQQKLKQIGVFGNKHIPVEYLFSSFEQRLNLVRGLMDTDGSTTGAGSCEFYQKNENLIDQFRTLLSTLGIKSKKTYRPIHGDRYWTVRFNTTLKVFNLERKNSKQKCKNHEKNKRLYIKEIRKVDSVPVRCLQVDNESHLFLCEKTLIPTHNTTTLVGIIIHRILFNENYSVAILAHKEKQANEILSRIQLAYEHLPKWLQQGIIEWNKGNIELENGSKVQASSTASSAIRGTSQNLVYLDEFAFVPNNIQEQFFASVYPTISSGETTKVLITSTPNGLNLFYKIWADSEEGRNSYTRVDVHWSQIPGRDEKWKEETIRNTSEEQFRQEFETEFLGSSSTLIAGAKLRTLVYRSPVKSDGSLKIYDLPQNNRMYSVTVDTGRGVDGDYSALQVFDVTELPYVNVASYRNKLIDPLVYPSIIFNVAKYYNNAFVLVETNDIGQQVADILQHDLEYDNLIFSYTSALSGAVVSGGFRGTSHAGVRTTKTVKKVGCSNLKSLIESDKLIINDFDTIQELFRFVSDGNSYKAEEGNDDLVMCCVIFAWLTDQNYFKELVSSNFRRNLYEENLKRIEEELTPFGIIENGLRVEEYPDVVDLEKEQMSFNHWLSS